MMTIDNLALELQHRARSGARALDLGRSLLDIAAEDFRPMTFIAAFHLAFDIPLRELQEAASWTGFGFEDVSDAEFEGVIDPHVERWRQVNL